MKLINSYIFLLREEIKYRIDENGNYNINLDKNVLYLLKQNYNAIEDELSMEEFENPTKKTEVKLDKIMRDVKTGKIVLKNKDIKAEFKLSRADTTEYLDIILNGSKKNELIEEMQIINNKITGKNNKFEKDFIVITSYDSVSEYYCNKIYPLLNNFERKFRKLLFITYTAQFKKAYFEETTSKEMQAKAKKTIRKSQDDIRLQNYLYALDFGMMKDLLFEKRWTPYDEKQLDKYLKRNKDLTALSDDELREKFKSIRPINDWERLFNNKDLNSEFEEIIKEIGELRNLVAHNKIFILENYERLKKLLEENIKTIDKAILITETEDFKKINDEKFNESMELMREVISNTLKQFADMMAPIVNACKNFKFPKIDIHSAFIDDSSNK